jgi:hypothetical protein
VNVKILALEHELSTATQEDFQRHAQDEAARAWALYQAGIIRELDFRADRPEAVLVLECPDLAAAQAALNTLPLVQQGLITFELIPLRAYPGFARLFAESGPINTS